MNCNQWHYDICSTCQQKNVPNNQFLPNSNQNYQQNQFPQSQPFLNMNNPLTIPPEYCKNQHRLIFSRDGIGY